VNLLCKRSSFCACQEQCRACFAPGQKASVQWTHMCRVVSTDDEMRRLSLSLADSSSAMAGQKLVLKSRASRTACVSRPAVQRWLSEATTDGCIETGQVTGASPGSRPCRTTPSRMCSAEDNSMHLSCYVRPTARPDRFSVLYYSYATTPPA
jgi:hypothetical protein